MRVALVYPHLFHHPAPSQPSGLAWLGAMLRARGHRVRMLDLSFVWNRSHAIPRFLSAVQPDLIALGVPYLDNDCAFHPLSFLPATRWIVDALRTTSRAPIVAGGWGVTQAPADTLRYLGLRFGFVGGDLARATEWLEAVAAGFADAEIPGAIRWDGVTYRAAAQERGMRARDTVPGTAAHELIDVNRHQAHGGAAVVSVALPLGDIHRRREPAEIDYELGVLQATAAARRVVFAGLCVGRHPDADDTLLDRLAMRGPGLAWEIAAEPAAVTRQRLSLARRGGARALRLVVEDGEPLDHVRAALERTASAIPVLVEIRIGGPSETGESLDQRLKEVAAISGHGVRLVLRPGARLWAPAADDVVERRGCAAGTSYIWPRFGFARSLEATLQGRLRDATATRAGASVDSDAYAPWRRVAHAASRCSRVWPSWVLDPYVADLAKRLRGRQIEKVPFRNQPR